MSLVNKSFVIICLLAALCACQQTAQEKSTDKSAQLGEVELKVTGSEAAQGEFKKGLLLLHSFEYEDARAAFQEAQEIDASFAMAYWGEAMSHHHTIWQKQDKEKALDALTKLASDKPSRAALLQTDLEKDLMEGAEILFGEGTKYDRDIAYKNHMENLTKKYPDNHEVSAFYAVSLLGASRNGRDEALYNKSAQIAQSIIAENPKHPGALHYLIHSYDDPDHAPLALTAADSYAKVAPDAAHALHMPSHIYVALGKWNEVIKSNIASWNASLNRMKRKSIDEDKRSYHAFNWLQYGLLQKGDEETATKLLKDMVKYVEQDDKKVNRAYLVAMKGGYMIETNTWKGDLTDTPVEVDDLSITIRTGYAFLEGMKAYKSGDLKMLKKVITKIEKDRNVAQLAVGEKGFAMCSAGGVGNQTPSQINIDMVQIMEMELEAYLATAEGNTKKAKELFEEASRLDESLTYSYGPPKILKPVHEAYGEWLLQQNQPKEALAIFEKSLDRHPRRLLSLKGKEKAASLINNEQLLAETKQELKTILEKKNYNEIL